MSRWLKLTLLLNNIALAGLAEEDAWELARMLVATGRAVEPGKWVDAMVHQANLDSFDSIA